MSGYPSQMIVDNPEFGDREPGVHYLTRPGSYGLVFDDQSRLLVLITSTGMHLPGGGRGRGETSEENLRRELMEECAIDVKRTTFIASAIQYLYAAGEGHFRKECDYYLIETDSLAEENEPGHAIRWVKAEEALTKLAHEGHRYGLRVALDCQ